MWQSFLFWWGRCVVRPSAEYLDDDRGNHIGKGKFSPFPALFISPQVAKLTRSRGFIEWDQLDRKDLSRYIGVRQFLTLGTTLVAVAILKWFSSRCSFIVGSGEEAVLKTCVFVAHLLVVSVFFQILPQLLAELDVRFVDRRGVGFFQNMDSSAIGRLGIFGRHIMIKIAAVISSPFRNRFRSCDHEHESSHKPPFLGVIS